MNMNRRSFHSPQGGMRHHEEVIDTNNLGLGASSPNISRQADCGYVPIINIAGDACALSSCSMSIAGGANMASPMLMAA